MQESPPPLPKSRPYTVMGNMKMGFPQTRIMKVDYPGMSAVSFGRQVICWVNTWLLYYIVVRMLAAFLWRCEFHDTRAYHPGSVDIPYLFTCPVERILCPFSLNNRGLHVKIVNMQILLMVSIHFL